MELTETFVVHPATQSRIGEVDFKDLGFGKFVIMPMEHGEDLRSSLLGT